MTSKKPATIKDIAKKLRVSPSTVSRALNDHPSIGLVTTMRVKKVAEELNYEPNQSAIFFKQRKTFTLGVILPKVSEPFFADAISAIEKIAEENDYTVILGQSLDNEKREENILKTFKKHRVDGIIMSLGKNTNNLEFIDFWKETGVPMVFFDCVPERNDVTKIYSDLSSGMEQAIDAFVSRGHQKIALINGPESLLGSKERLNAFKKYLKKHKLPFEKSYIANSDLTTQSNELAMDELLSLAERPSAVISFNDYVTLDAMKYAKQKGVRINQDLFLISYANYPLWKYMDTPPIGCIEQFSEQQAVKATEILLELIDLKKSEQHQEIIIPSQLVLN